MQGSCLGQLVSMKCVCRHLCPCSAFFSYSLSLHSLLHSIFSSPLSGDTKDARVINPCGFLFLVLVLVWVWHALWPRPPHSLPSSTRQLDAHCITSILILTDSTRRAVAGSIASHRLEARQEGTRTSIPSVTWRIKAHTAYIIPLLIGIGGGIFN